MPAAPPPPPGCPPAGPPAAPASSSPPLIAGGRRHRRGATRDLPGAERIADEAARAFVAQYGPGPGAPMVVVIPALDEEASVAAVVESVPAAICGLDVETLLVDDGSTDGTAGAARSAGALVCRLPVNLGQGHAFRLGYRLARERGARIIGTADADGQFDPRELPALVAPILEGRADFVNGSRRLGRAETTDPVRKAGVVVFGALVSALTGTRITDPANGLRAFRAEVTEKVELRQTQYQTSELLIGAIARGLRVVEAPATMYARTVGESKKGHNVLYGLRFARVVIATWWAQRRSRSADRNT
ncbi:MAG: glycosyltransferase family 2 protein [Acidimicrobiales bacterium]